jgi:hypothetical protein
MTTTNRAAVVVVHGIADQRPGQTVLELARLLCHGGDRAQYAQGEIDQVLVPVEKLEPGSDRMPPAAPPAGAPEPARRRPGMPSGFYQKQQAESSEAAVSPGSPAPRAPGPKPQGPAVQDLGIALNDYLLERLRLPEGDALYEAARTAGRSTSTRCTGPISRASGRAACARSPRCTSSSSISTPSRPTSSTRCR